jgi:hypothetical protein
LNPPT